MQSNFKKIFISIISLLTAVSSLSAKEYSLLQWNIWQEGTRVEGGYDAIVAELHRLSPDFVCLSEVRNYHDVDFMAKLVSDLQNLGDNYYTSGSYDTGLLSKYPIEKFDTISPHENDHGTIHRLYATTQEGDKFAIYTAHLDYLNCAYYEPRGYSGNTWEEVEIPASVEEIIYMNDLSNRDNQIRQFIEAAEKDIAEGRTVIIGGDFNEPSYLDWQEDTAGMRDHQGFIVPWTVSMLLKDAGFIDSYREIYPDPVSQPGFTFPSANPDVAIKRLTWAPKSDERERIDFIYYKSPRKFNLTDTRVFGPTDSIERSSVVKDEGSENYVVPLGVWPTDHKGLIINFSLQ